MSHTTSKPTLRELRSQFLKQSKLFCRALELESQNFDEELKSQILVEMRQKMKDLMELINQMEKEESDKSIPSKK